mmetsp:Transcript_5978/g.17675  ORF Transcript_5978/g.17675 Transcript_5978/m.17675 type:complete len:379 (-) Transcript_5978:272-1408(-)
MVLERAATCALAVRKSVFSCSQSSSSLRTSGCSSSHVLLQLLSIIDSAFMVASWASAAAASSASLAATTLARDSLASVWALAMLAAAACLSDCTELLACITSAPFLAMLTWLACSSCCASRRSALSWVLFAFRRAKSPFVNWSSSSLTRFSSRLTSFSNFWRSVTFFMSSLSALSSCFWRSPSSSCFLLTSASFCFSTTWPSWFTVAICDPIVMAFALAFCSLAFSWLLRCTSWLSAWSLRFTMTAAWAARARTATRSRSTPESWPLSAAACWWHVFANPCCFRISLDMFWVACCRSFSSARACSSCCSAACVAPAALTFLSCSAWFSFWSSAFAWAANLWWYKLWRRAGICASAVAAWFFMLLSSSRWSESSSRICA